MPRSEDAPAVPGYDGRPGDWISMSQAAALLGQTRQNANLMAHGGKFKTLHTIAQGTMFVVSEAELTAGPVPAADGVPSADAPPVPGYAGPGDWILLSQASRILNMSRQNVSNMAKSGRFNSLHVFAQGTMFVVSEAEILGIVALAEVKLPSPSV